MKRVMTLCVLVLTLTMALCPAALAADLGSAATAAQVCYPTSISRSEDGTELKKIYDLGPEDDPAGIPRSDFEQDGFHYTLTDLLKQELPENESRQHTETVSLPSKNKDMESVLALLPAEKEFVTDDGLTGILSLDLSTVRWRLLGMAAPPRKSLPHAPTPIWLVRIPSTSPRLSKRMAGPDASNGQLADRQYRKHGWICRWRPFHRCRHLYRNCDQFLCERIYRDCGLYRNRQPHRPE